MIRGPKTVAKIPPKKPAAARRIPAAALPAHAAELYRRLVALYPDAHCELDFRSPYELLVATILSAQCTDKRVNLTTPALFARYPDPRALAQADQRELEALVKSTGFFRTKARNLIAMARDVVANSKGEIPATMDALHALAGDSLFPSGDPSEFVIRSERYGIPQARHRVHCRNSASAK